MGTYTDGDYSSVAIALNGLYDFNLFGDDKVKTYVGTVTADYEPLTFEISGGWRF